MKLPHIRPICRAPNRFSPSVALYQHFVLPYNALRQQRFSSSAPAPTAADAEASPSSTSDPSPPSASPSGNAEIRPPPNIDQPARVRIKFVDPDAHRRLAGKEEKKKQLEKLQQKSKQTNQKWAKRNRDNLESQAQESRRFIEQIMLKSRLAADVGEEYTGFVVQPMPATQLVPEQKYPWASRTSQKKSEPMERLNREIYDFWEYAKPTRAETFARKNLVEQVRADVRQRFPNHVLEVFGSERTGISFATSDIDLRLTRREALDQVASDKPPTPSERRDLMHDLYTLRYKVFAGRNRAAARYIFPTLRHARYPLLSLQDRETGLDIQIVLSNNTAKAREYMQRYMAEYPYLRQVYAVVKTMFDQRGLADVYRGGFGSYTIFMMIVASLQNQANQRKDAAGALVNFLYYWAYFKTRDHGVSISPPEYFDKKKHPVLTDTARAKIADGTQAPLPDWMLCLRDPADETNDLGRKGSCILHVQATLRQLVNDTIKELNANKRSSLLAPLVGHIYARDRLRREKLADHGSWVQRQVQRSFAVAAKDIHGRNQGDIPQQVTAKEAPKEQEESDVHGHLNNDGAATESGGDSVASTFGIPSAEDWVNNPEAAQEQPGSVTVKYTATEGDVEPVSDNSTAATATEPTLALRAQIGDLHAQKPVPRTAKTRKVTAAPALGAPCQG